MTARQNKDQPLRLLVIGCGRASRAHFKAIAYLEKKGRVVLGGLVDRDPAIMEEVLAQRDRRLAKPYISQDLDAALADNRFDAAVIATPPLTHAPLALKALEAGCHLVMEKPLTLDLGQADQILEEAKARQKLIAMGFKYRYIPGVEAIRSLITSGALGPVLYGTTTVRWGHDQAYYDQAPWFGSWEAEGGALMNQGIHALDLMAWLMDARPLEAAAVLARQAHDMEAADLVSGTLTLENNAYLMIEATTNTKPDYMEASFFLRCGEGTVRASFASGKQSVSVRRDDGKDLARGLIWKAVRGHIRRQGPGLIRHLGNPYTFLYLDLLEAIRDKRDPLAPGQAGRESLAQGLALLQAGKEKRTVPYPPQGFGMGDLAGLFD